VGNGEQSLHLTQNVAQPSCRSASWHFVAALYEPKLFVTAVADRRYSNALMIKGFGGDITINIIASIVASLVLLAAGFLWGKYKERRKYGRNLEDYDFYPFTINRENFPEFNLKDFRLGMHYFLKNNDYTAARQLIFIGEQNNVRNQLEPAEQKVYARLFEKYHGKKIADDTSEYLENYVRIVRLIGKSFPNSGIEILLHNLADPSHSLIVLENNVTGRHLRDGTTNLLIDLKKRQLLHEDKLNYELNIGARKFKCTTIPILRKDFGIVGAICINIDANYLTDEVMQSKERIEAWFKNFCRTDMQLDENILSKDDYAKAMKGQRHFKDEAF
jgi:predicted transcriptional regulator YheO